MHAALLCRRAAPPGGTLAPPAGMDRWHRPRSPRRRFRAAPPLSGAGRDRRPGGLHRDGTTSRSSPRPHWPTPSSRPSIRSPTATDAPAGRSCTPPSGASSSATHRAGVGGPAHRHRRNTSPLSTRYRAGDAAEIVRLMATASLTALTNARQLVADLDDIRNRWAEVIRARRDASAWQLADLFLRHPSSMPPRPSVFSPPPRPTSIGPCAS